MVLGLPIFQGSLIGLNVTLTHRALFEKQVIVPLGKLLDLFFYKFLNSIEWSWCRDVLTQQIK